MRIGIGIGMGMGVGRASGPQWAIDYDASRSAGPLAQLPAGSTFTRASVAVGFDHLGRPFIGKSGEIVEWGKRRVENRLNISSQNHIFTDVLEDGSVRWYRETGQPDPFGGNQATRIHTTSTTVGGVSFGISAGPLPSLVSLYLKKLPGRQVRLLIRNLSTGTNYQSIQILTGSPAGNPSWTVTDINDEWFRVETLITDSIGTSTNTFAFYLYGGFSGGYDECVFYGLQAESMYPGQTEPSEYVSNGVLSAPYHGWGVDGVKYFNTDESGDPIPAATMRGIIAMPSLTNVVRAASDMTQSNWTKAAAALTVTAAYDQTMGGAYTQVRNLGATGVDSVSQGWTGLTNDGRYEPCWIMRAVDASGVVRLRATTGAGDWDIDLSAVSAGDIINRSHAAVTVNTEIAANGSGALTLEFDAESGSLDFDVSCITLVAGTAPAATPIPNTSTSAAATRNADSLVVNVPDGSYSISTTYGDGSTEAVSDTASSGLTLTSADFSKATVKKMQGNPA